MDRIPGPELIASAAANAFDTLVGSGVADLRPTPRSIIAEAPHRTIYRYLAGAREHAHDLPVLLVPPLAAPASCFDLRRGCSLAEHLIAMGHPTYLVDYGRIAFSDRELGLEHWVEQVIPETARAVSEDAGGGHVQIVSWSLGGIMSVLAVAGAPDLPIRSIAAVGSPFDFAQVQLMAPIRRLANLTGGALGTALIRALGGVPEPLVRRGFQLTAIDRYLTKPVAVAQHLHDREWLAQMEAVDSYMGDMIAYPGRSMVQLYHQFFRINALREGKLELNKRTIELAAVRIPVLSVAGTSDVLAPIAAVHHIAELLPNSPEVRLETAPGGHLGVLTGRSARTTTWVYIDEFFTAHGAARAVASAA